jgi:hypothetical protein
MFIFVFIVNPKKERKTDYETDEINETDEKISGDKFRG